MAQVSIRKVVKVYEGDVQAVKGIDLEIADHEFVVLVGPSGCGKSTTLRMIAGLEEITAGEIAIGGDGGERHPAARPRHRHGVPELRALSAHDRLRQHGLRPEAAEVPQGGDQAPGGRTPRASSTSTCCWTASRRRSRAASASASPWAAPSCATPRSSCSTSRCPTSTPSCACRCAPRSRSCTRRSSTTTVYVTHDQVEAMTLADRVVVMNHGVIEQVGPPQELYHNPATRFVAGFIGSPAMNFIPARLVNGGAALNVELAERHHACRCRRTAPPATRPHAGKEVTLRHPARAPDRARPNDHASTWRPSRRRPRWWSRWAWRRCCTSGCRATRSAPASIPAPPRRPACMQTLAADMNHMHLIDPQTDKVAVAAPGAAGLDPARRPWDGLRSGIAADDCRPPDRPIRTGHGNAMADTPARPHRRAARSKRLIADIFAAAGCDRAEAARISTHLLGANLDRP